MSEQCIQYSEEMVGAGHPTKPDTLNRLALVETGADGHGKFRYLAVQASAPATGASEGVLYTKLAAGQAELFHRSPSSGAEARLTRRGELADLLRPRQVASLWPDEQAPAEFDATYNAVRLANAGGLAWGDFKAWLEGVAWRVRLDCLMTTSEANSFSLSLYYQVVAQGAAAVLVKARWQASTAYASGDKVVPSAPNGYHYQCTAAGQSGASAPTWPTTAGQTVGDGTATWQCIGAGLKALGPLALTPASGAYQRFGVDTASLQIPSAEVALDSRVHWGLLRSAGDPHAGDLLVCGLEIAPVEV